MERLEEIFAKVDFLDDVLETLQYNGKHLEMETILEMVKAASLAASDAQVGFHNAMLAARREEAEAQESASKQILKEEGSSPSGDHESAAEIYEDGYRDGINAALGKISLLIVDPAIIGPMSPGESQEFYACRAGLLDAETEIKNLLEEDEVGEV